MNYSFRIAFACLLLLGFSSCSNEKPGDSTPVDSVHDTITAQDQNDSTKIRFKQLVSAMPVPFDMLKKFSGAKLPFKGELLNAPENVVSYNSADMQAVNLGIYGADLAYLISQDKLGEGAPYLKSIHRISDEIVMPSAFDASTLKRYDANQEHKDSLQNIMRSSYKRIDSTLQGNDRLVLATLVITGGWLESIYLTTQHIGDEKQNEKNKVLYDMVAVQQPYVENISGLLGSFPQDSSCAMLHRDFEQLKKIFPKGPDVPAAQFSEQLKELRLEIAEIRNRLVRIQ